MTKEEQAMRPLSYDWWYDPATKTIVHIDPETNVQDHVYAQGCTFNDPTPQRFPALYFFGNDPREHPTPMTVAKVIDWVTSAIGRLGYVITAREQHDVVSWLYKMDSYRVQIWVENINGSLAQFSAGRLAGYFDYPNQEQAKAHFKAEVERELRG